MSFFHVVVNKIDLNRGQFKPTNSISVIRNKILLCETLLRYQSESSLFVKVQQSNLPL